MNERINYSNNKCSDARGKSKDFIEINVVNC